MAFFGQGWKSSGTTSNQPPSLTQTVNQVASDLGKQAKLKLGHEAILLNQMKEIAAAEIRDVAALKAKHLGEPFQRGTSAAEDGMGNIIICDGYHNNDPPHGSPWIGKLVSAALLLAGLLGGAVAGPSLWYLATRASSSSSSTTIREVAPAEFEFDWTVKDGKMVIQPRPGN